MGLTCQRYITPLYQVDTFVISANSLMLYFISYINFSNNTYLSHLQQFHQYVFVNKFSVIKMRDVQDTLIYCPSSVFPPRECSFVETKEYACCVYCNMKYAMCAETVPQVHCIQSVSIINEKDRQTIINPTKTKTHSPFMLSSQFIKYSYGCSEIHPQSCFALSHFACCKKSQYNYYLAIAFIRLIVATHDTKHNSSTRHNTWNMIFHIQGRSFNGPG